MDMVLKPESHNLIDYLWSSHPMPWTSDCGDIISASRNDRSIFAIIKLIPEKIEMCENKTDEGFMLTVYDANGSPFMAEFIPSEKMNEEKVKIGIRNLG